MSDGDLAPFRPVSKRWWMKNTCMKYLCWGEPGVTPYLRKWLAVYPRPSSTSLRHQISPSPYTLSRRHRGPAVCSQRHSGTNTCLRTCTATNRRPSRRSPAQEDPHRDSLKSRQHHVNIDCSCIEGSVSLWSWVGVTLHVGLGRGGNWLGFTGSYTFDKSGSV